jgi:putative cell wall-binding protein
MKRRSRWLRYGGAAALAAVTATAGLLPLTSSPASAATITTTRYAGADRYGTAQDIATGVFGTASTAILATGLNFPDALAASYLAGNLNAPVLLTDPNTLSPETAAALGTLKTANVIIVGGTDAVSQAVVTSLEATASTASAGGNLTVTRISGATRFDTAAAIDSTPAATTVGSFDGKKTAILATGDDFPDALFAGPLSYSNHFPIILTDSTTLSPQAATELTSLGIQQVIIMGGTAAVSAAVESAVNAAGATTLFRAAGADRDDTAAKLLSWELTNISGVDHDSVYLARDDSPDGFADALAMGPAAGKLDLVGGLGAGAPGGSLPTETSTELQALGAGNATAAGTLYIPGGTAAVSAAQAATAAGLLSGTNTAASTTLPQLISAKILTTVTPGEATTAVPAGTYVQYVFSQNVTTAILNAAGFKVYPSSGPPTTGYIADAATIDPTNPDAVDGSFLGEDALNLPLTTTTGAAALTLATIQGPQAAGAAATPALAIGTAQAPAGSSGIGTAATGGGQAGVTSAPDLESVGNFRAGCNTVVESPQLCINTVTAIDFTYNKPAYVVTPGSFFVVEATAADSAGPVGPATELACTGPAVGSSTPASGGTVPGGNGTTTLTIICPNIGAVPGTTPMTAASIARAGQLADAVATAGSAVCPVDGGLATSPTGTYCNPTETAVSPHVGSLSPDLVTVSIVPQSNGGLTDSIVETYDEPVAAGTIVDTDLGYYNTSGAEILSGGAAINGVPAVVQNPADSAQLSINFAPGSTTAAVGGVSLHGAVTGANNGNASRDDALGASNPATTAEAPGSIAAPQLTGAAVLTSSNVFGVASDSILYTWSMNLAAPAPNALFLHAYDADGTELTCATGFAVNGAQGTIAALQPNQSICSSFTLAASGVADTPPSAGQVASVVLANVDAGYATGATSTVGSGIDNPAGSVVIAAG